MLDTWEARYLVNDTGCWVWQGARCRDGYGTLWVDGKRKWLAHRYLWTVANGPIPEGLESDHLCHNRACVNPDHIRLVTHKENTQNRRGGRGVSRHRGVSWNGRRWATCVTIDGKRHHLGNFDDEDEAGRVTAEFRRRMMPGALA